jgi:prepilin peptidase CpaA
MSGPFVFSFAILVLTLVAALFDWRTGKIPNALTLGSIPLAIAVHAYSVPARGAWEAAGWAVVGSIVCTLPLVLLWRARWMGGGDLKLLAAMGAWGGASLGLEASFLAFLSAMGFVLLRLTYNGGLWTTLGNGLAVVGTRLLPAKRRVLPRGSSLQSLRFGPFALAGAAFAFLLHGAGGFR